MFDKNSEMIFGYEMLGIIRRFSYLLSSVHVIRLESNGIELMRSQHVLMRIRLQFDSAKTVALVLNYVHIEIPTAIGVTESSDRCSLILKKQ